MNLCRLSAHSRQRLLQSNDLVHLEDLHAQWYGWDSEGHPVRGGMNRDLFVEVDRKIREAARRLRIGVEDAGELFERNEGWDGEMNAELLVLEHVLDTIAGKERRY